MPTPLRYLIDFLQKKYENKNPQTLNPILMSDDMYKISHVPNINVDDLKFLEEREALWGKKTEWPPHLAEISIEDAIKLLIIRTPEFFDARVVNKTKLIIYDFGQGNGVLLKMQFSEENEIAAYTWGCKHKHLITRSLGTNQITKTCSNCNQIIRTEEIRKTL